MCNITGIEFGQRNLTRERIEGKRVIEVGAYDVNGSVRGPLTSLKPSEYVGVDISEGPGVDVVCDAAKLADKFGRESFDVVISTEMLEHVLDWRAVVTNLKSILRPNGYLLITTRSPGYPYHGYPYDFWRFELKDMEQIFSDMEQIVIEPDVPTEPGVFVFVRKPVEFTEVDLTDYPLFSILTNSTCSSVSSSTVKLAKLKYGTKNMLASLNALVSRVRNSFNYRVRGRQS